MACFSDNCNQCDDTLVCWFESDNTSINVASIVDGYYSQIFDGCRALVSVHGLPSSAMSQYLETVHEFTGSTSLGSTTNGGGYEGYGDGDICNSCEISDGYISGAHVVEYGLRRVAPEGHEESPSNDTEILDSSMSHLPDLVKVYIPSSVTKIKVAAFANCSKLKTIVIGTGTREIGHNAFQSGAIENIDWGCCNGKELRLGNAAFRDSHYLKDLDIPDCIKSCGEDCFSRCDNLSGLTIGNGLTEISTRMFSYCSKLETVTIPNTIKTIGSGAFGNCSSLKSIVIPDNVTDIGVSAFINCTSLTSATIGNGVTIIPFGAFYNCSALNNVAIGNNVIDIQQWAFLMCSGLHNVVIPDSVSTIGILAFGACTSLTSVTIGNNVTNIGEKAFFSGTSLTAITIPNSVSTIGDSAFSGCTSISSITIGSGVTSIGNNAFECPAVQVLNYNARVGVPNDFMHDKVYLRVVTIGDKTPSIGENAFMECSALTNVAIGRNVKTINTYAFAECESLTNIVIPDSVTTIGPDAFFNCIGLTSVTIGNGVTTINNAAFYGCSSLESVTIDAIVPPILESGNEFNNTNNCPIYVPSGSVSTYKTAEGWRNYASRIVSQ